VLFFLSDFGVFDDMNAGYDPATHWKNKLFVEIRDEEAKLLEAARTGNVIQVQKLLDDDLAEVDCRTSQERFTPLIEAAHHGQLPALRALVHGKAKLNFEDLSGNTALHHAAQAGHFRVVRYLIDSGADLSIKNHDKKLASQLTTASNIVDILRTGGGGPEIAEEGKEVVFAPNHWTKNITFRLENELEPEKVAALLQRLSVVSQRVTGDEPESSSEAPTDQPASLSTALEKTLAGIEKVLNSLAKHAGVGEDEVTASAAAAGPREPVGDDSDD